MYSIPRDSYLALAGTCTALHVTATWRWQVPVVHRDMGTVAKTRAFPVVDQSINVPVMHEDVGTPGSHEEERVFKSWAFREQAWHPKHKQ